MPELTSHLPAECCESLPMASRTGMHAPDLAAIARHFDRRADHYAEKYSADEPRHLYEHEKRERARWTCRWVDQFARQNDAAGRLLDVGCGDGRTVRRILADLPHWHGTGVDVSDHMIQRAKTQSGNLQHVRRVQWRTGTLEQVAGTFDVVVSLGVVGYQADQRAFLSELAARVRFDGLLIFTFANEHSVPRRLRTAAQSIRRFGRGSSDAVRFQTLARRQVDDHLAECGLHRTALRWLGFGLGVRRGGFEVKLSRWCEARWGDSLWAQPLAQVGLACYRRSRMAVTSLTQPPVRLENLPLLTRYLVVVCGDLP